jgi:glycosyltransferase involved in cell wall biosynthesis
VSHGATVVITTKDRRDELRVALGSVLAQEPPVDDVLVIDDGSTDATADMVRSEFPSVRVHRSDVSRGLIAQRNAAADLVTTDIIVSIDDDAVLTSPRTVAQTLADFHDPRIGVVAIPYVDVTRSPDVLQRAPGPGVWVADTYVGTAHALRRDVFLEIGRYRAELVRQTEEPDFSIRMLARGYVVRLGTADPLEHRESDVRAAARQAEFGARNLVRFGWHNVPLPYLPVRWAKVVVLAAILAVRWRLPGATARGLALGFLDAARHPRARRPVPRSVYRLDHELRRRGPLRLEAIERRLPPASLDQPAMDARRWNAST